MALPPAGRRTGACDTTPLAPRSAQHRTPPPRPQHAPPLVGRPARSSSPTPQAPGAPTRPAPTRRRPPAHTRRRGTVTTPPKNGGGNTAPSRRAAPCKAVSSAVLRHWLDRVGRAKSPGEVVIRLERQTGLGRGAVQPRPAATLSPGRHPASGTSLLIRCTGTTCTCAASATCVRAKNWLADGFRRSWLEPIHLRRRRPLYLYRSKAIITPAGLRAAGHPGRCERRRDCLFRERRPVDERCVDFLHGRPNDIGDRLQRVKVK